MVQLLRQRRRPRLAGALPPDTEFYFLINPWQVPEGVDKKDCVVFVCNSATRERNGRARGAGDESNTVRLAGEVVRGEWGGPRSRTEMTRQDTDLESQSWKGAHLDKDDVECMRNLLFSDEEFVSVWGVRTIDTVRDFTSWGFSCTSTHQGYGV